jgi:ribonuclease Z
MPSFEVIKKLKEGIAVELEPGKVISVEDHTLPPKHQRVYAYCSDTKYEPSIIPFIRDSDLLYHEATYSDSQTEKAKINFHSTAQEAAQIALKANVKRLILGHFSSRYKLLEPLLEEAKTVFPETELTIEGTWYVV